MVRNKNLMSIMKVLLSQTNVSSITNLIDSCQMMSVFRNETLHMLITDVKEK